MHTDIAALVADYWLRVDRRSDDPVDELYLDDGVFSAGSVDLYGRAAIRDYFADRDQQQDVSGRLTRHIQLNLQLSMDSTDRVICRSTVIVFAGTGTPPLDTAVPSTIADADDVCVRCADGGWKFASRRLTPIFLGPTAAAFTRQFSTDARTRSTSTEGENR